MHCYSSLFCVFFFLSFSVCLCVCVFLSIVLMMMMNLRMYRRKFLSYSHTLYSMTPQDSIQNTLSFVYRIWYCNGNFLLLIWYVWLIHWYAYTSKSAPNNETLFIARNISPIILDRYSYSSRLLLVVLVFIICFTRGYSKWADLAYFLLLSALLFEDCMKSMEFCWWVFMDVDGLRKYYMIEISTLFIYGLFFDSIHLFPNAIILHFPTTSKMLSLFHLHLIRMG